MAKRNNNQVKEPKKYIVTTPVKNYCGIGAGGIQFAYGKAEVCEGTVLEWYREHDYGVEEINNEDTNTNGDGGANGET